MLIDILRGSGTIGEKILYIFIIAFCVLLSLSVHEMSHGLTAYLIGDKTAKYSGRLSINPLHHLDPIGAICLFLFGFGWAKPVPVNPWNFKNKKWGMALTAFGGPLSNLILAFIAYVIYVVVGRWDGLWGLISIICYYLIICNVGLGLFNLIPIPPLDGSKILGAVLPQNLYFKFMEYERYGFIILIILINTSFFSRFMSEARFAIISFYDLIISLFM